MRLSGMCRAALGVAAALVIVAWPLWPQTAATEETARPARAAASPELTIYNQNFAVVRAAVPLDLHAGVNRVRYAGVTGLVAPGSVILRPLSGQPRWRILEQNYRADPVSEHRLLERFQGQTIHFLVTEQGRREVIAGKILRAGWNPPPGLERDSYPAPPQPLAPESAPPRQPLIEVNGELRFGLPGQPLFPALPPGTILRPLLSWRIASPAALRTTAELNYLTGGLSWSARYNAVQGARGGPLAVYGWDRLKNWSGHSFRRARIELMAGQVRYRSPSLRYGQQERAWGGVIGGFAGRPLVRQAPFDVYYLYTLRRPATLRAGETKAIEFLRASGVRSRRYFVYDGLQVGQNYANWDYAMIRRDASFGTGVTHQVRVARAFANTRANGLGVPLPAGLLRFYRRDASGQIQFLGQDRIADTPQGQTVRAVTGAAFDLRGNRVQTDYQLDQANRVADESFRITLLNRRSRPAEIRVIEHLYRGETWRITAHSDLYAKRDSHTIEFRVTVPADGQKVVSYTVHYSW